LLPLLALIGAEAPKNGSEQTRGACANAAIEISHSNMEAPIRGELQAGFREEWLKAGAGDYSQSQIPEPAGWDRLRHHQPNVSSLPSQKKYTTNR